MDTLKYLKARKRSSLLYKDFILLKKLYKLLKKLYKLLFVLEKIQEITIFD